MTPVHQLTPPSRTETFDAHPFRSSVYPEIIPAPAKAGKQIWNDSFIGLSVVSLIAIVYFFFFKEENLKMVLFVSVNFVLCYGSACMQTAHNVKTDAAKGRYRKPGEAR